MTPAAIRAIREAAGMSQAQLARRMRVHVNTIQSWEYGTRKPLGPAVLMLETLRDSLPAKSRRKP